MKFIFVFQIDANIQYIECIEVVRQVGNDISEFSFVDLRGRESSKC